MSSTKKIRLFLFSLLVLIAGTSFVLASATDTISGYAWSSNIGWIKTNNCTDPSDTTTCDGGQAYGLTTTVPTTKTGTSAITGYAWSSNIGWINFQPGICVTNGCTNPTINWDTGKISGFAQACGVYITGCTGTGPTNSYMDNLYLGGWDGFISLNPKNASGAVLGGVSVNTSTGVMSGYAWGSDVLGWINFDGVKIKITTPTCPDGTPMPATGICQNVNQPTMTFEGPSCVAATDPYPVFSWYPNLASFTPPSKPNTVGTYGYSNISMQCKITKGGQIDTIVANPNDDITTSSLETYLGFYPYVTGKYFKNTSLVSAPDPMTLSSAQKNALTTSWYKTSIASTLLSSAYILQCDGMYWSNETPSIRYEIHNTSTATAPICPILCTVTGSQPNTTNTACICTNGGNITNNCIIPPTTCPTGQKLNTAGTSCICNDGTPLPTTGANTGICPKKTPKYIES
jgi:hypothetical protein